MLTKVPGETGTFEGSFGIESQSTSQQYYAGPSMGYALTDSLRIGVTALVFYSTARINEKLYVGARPEGGASGLTFVPTSAFSESTSIGLRGIIGV